jgi:hypothetical protein
VERPPVGLSGDASRRFPRIAKRAPRGASSRLVHDRAARRQWRGGHFDRAADLVDRLVEVGGAFLQR